MINTLFKFILRDNPFALAARFGDLKRLKTLIEKNPRIIEQKDDQGESLLHKSAAYGHLNICEYLVNQGVPIDIKIDAANATPLMLAVSFNNQDVVEYFLSKGADINNQDKDGVSSLHYAVSRNLPEMVQLLKEYGANQRLSDKFGRTPLDLATELKLTRIIELLKVKQ